MKYGPVATPALSALIRQDGGYMEPVTLFETREILVPFDIGDYRLIPGCAGDLGEPVEAFLLLYAVAAASTTHIAGPTDLSGITRAVRSSEEALAFVRLFTSPRSHFLFDKQQTILDLVVAGPDARQAGEVSREVAQRLWLPALRCVEASGAFEIERCLVRAQDAMTARTVLLRTERVSADGDYRWVGERVLGLLSPDEVAMPLYE
jgi:hypothetical protein